jgi:hypothetical protein
MTACALGDAQVRQASTLSAARLFAAKYQPDKAMTFSTMWRTAVK